jgi:colanic acid/amylovoran biosynthesis protein
MRRGLADLVSVRGKVELVRAVGTSDAVISSGGGYFWSDRPIAPGPMFIQSLLHLRLASARRKPVVFFPQSFGPIASEAARRLLARELRAPNVRIIFARETESLGFVERLLEGRTEGRVLAAPDMAFGLDPGDWRTPAPVLPIPEMPRPVVALTLRRWNFPEVPDPAEKKRRRERYLGAMAGLARYVAGPRKGSVVVFCQARGPGPFEDDRLVTAEFLEAIRPDIAGDRLAFVSFPETVHPSSIIGLLESADLAVATRFHSAIYSLLARTPALALNYQPKSRSTMRDLGLGDFTLDVADIEPDGLVGLAGGMLDRLDEIRERVRSSVSQAREALDRRLSEARVAFGGAP